jgi:hypothetical protein
MSKQNKPQNESQLKEDITMATIVSLFNSAKKRNEETRFVVSKDILIFKLVDTYKIPETKAKEILMILQSRNLLEIEKGYPAIVINVEEIKKYLDKYINNIFNKTFDVKNENKSNDNI